jgi:ATP/maltotriose-dependent transcriptional regulator MalT
MLDKSDARIILLVAPAGYGKTTLAHEWLDERNAAWYRGGPASADVAALAVGLATATSKVVPKAGERMRQRLKATTRPEEDARILAEMLAEDLAEWPEDAWLVIDDYHFAMDSPASEAFIETLCAVAKPPLLVTSRRRPSWASARLRLYGHVVEIDQTALAMSDDEAFDLLSDRTDASGLIQQAAGWPAVLGLAALTGKARTPSTQLPTPLYDYFADELLQEVDDRSRRALCHLALVPSISEEAAVELLGNRLAGHALEESLSTGILHPSPDGDYELHPLLRTFLHERLHESGREARATAVQKAGTYLLSQRRWDDALLLARQFRSQKLVEDLIASAWESMLDEGRLATLSGLTDFAAELRIRSPLLDLVEAELAFRQAAYEKAETLAVEATRNLDSDHLLVRAHVRAGQSAHLVGRDDDAIAHHRRAQAIAGRKSDKREAVWGEFVCAMELESKDSEAVLARLEGLGSDNATDRVRIAMGQMLTAVRHGRGFDPKLFLTVHRLPRVDDPLVRSSFLHVWAYVLTYTSRYPAALDVTDQLLREAEEYRLEFVVPHGLIRRALALRGLKRFREALDCLAKSQRDRSELDDHLAVAADSARIGVYLAFGDLRRAAAVPEPTPGTSAAPSLVAELLALKSLALACAGRLADSTVAADRSHALSNASEPNVLRHLALAISAIKAEAPDASESTDSAFDALSMSGNFDAFVTAYRGFPPLLQAVATTEERRSQLSVILRRAGDEKLGKEFLPREALQSVALPGLALLTPRETEVLELISEGLRNRDIAERLFITEVTVKVHVRNILRKLGARSRAHAVALAKELGD